MSVVKIPLEMTTTGADSAKKIKEDIAKAKEDLKDIEDKVDSAEPATTKTPTTKKAGKTKPGESPTKIDKVLEQDLGTGKAGNILGYATNPSGAVLQQLFKIGALPAAILGAPVIADKVILSNLKWQLQEMKLHYFTDFNPL